MNEKWINTKLGALIWVVLCISLFLLLNSQLKTLKIETNILKLLPPTETSPIVDRAFKNFAEKNMQQLVFLTESKDESVAKRSADELSHLLIQSPWIDTVVSDITSKKQVESAKVIFNYKYHLLNNFDQNLLAEKQYEVFSEDSVQALFSPISGGLGRLVQSDPFLLSYRFSQSNIQDSKLSLNQEHLTANYDGKYYVLVSATLNASPFDPNVQKDIISGIKKLEDKWLVQKTKNSLIRTGALFYASEAYDTAKGEISTIGLTSLILVIVLILFSFKSIRPLLLTSLALVFGISCGFTAILLVFEEIHLLTLVFGASLIGVAVDYAFHYFSTDSSSQDWGRLRKILPAISLGLISSIVGYLALLSTPFPGLQQMATFCIAGLTGAFITVALLFPVINLNNNLSISILKLCDSILSLGACFPTRKIWIAMWLLPIFAIVLSFQDTENKDDIRQFQNVNIDLKYQENLIKDILQPDASNQFYLVRGKSPQSLLINMEFAQDKLSKLVDDGVINSFVNISQQLPSIHQQKTNYNLIKELVYSDAFDNFIELDILTKEDYLNFKVDFEAKKGNYMVPDFWLNSPVGEMFSNLWLGKIGSHYSAIIPIRGINNLSELEDINPQILFVDKVSKINLVFKKYRHHASQLLFVAILLICFILSFRYGLIKSIIIASSPIFSISITIIILSILGVSLTLFNTLALFLVVGIGIDYGLFFAESNKAKAGTLMAILLSALTTVFSFGLLALSETTAIKAFGLTMLIGITSAFIISPFIGYLLLEKKVYFDANK